ncbi:septum formation initiator family protein [Candidatus Margulisiibacteriota bacterium]
MKIPKSQRTTVNLLIVAAVLALLHLYIQNQSINLKYDYVKEKIKFQEVYEKNRELSSRVARRSSLDRIEKISREELKMIYPEEITYIISTTQEAKS